MRAYFSAFALVLWLTGCTTTAPQVNTGTLQFPAAKYSAVGLPRETLDTWLYERIWEPSIMVSDTYSLPTKEWFLGTFASAWLDVMYRENLQYTVDKWECGSYAIDAMLHAKKCHLFTANSQYGLAVGCYGYYDWLNEVGHAIIFAITVDSGQTNITYMEPQNGKEVRLDPSIPDRYSMFLFM